MPPQPDLRQPAPDDDAPQAALCGRPWHGPTEMLNPNTVLHDCHREVGHAGRCEHQAELVAWG